MKSPLGPHAKWGGCDVIGLYRRSTFVEVGQCPPETQSDQRKERPYRRCSGNTWTEGLVPRETTDCHPVTHGMDSQNPDSNERARSGLVWKLLLSLAFVYLATSGCWPCCGS